MQKPVPSYKKDRSFSDLFIPEIKQIIGPRLLIESTFEVDTRQAEDLTVLLVDNKSIAARVRRPGYLKYRHEFTVRSRRDSGAETELSKIYDGWGEWMFYAHAASNNPDDGFACWMLINLSSFRSQMIKYRKTIRWTRQSNNDGTYFNAFDVFSFRPAPPILVDCQGIYECD